MPKGGRSVKRSFMLKTLLVAALAMTLMLPVAMIRDLVAERQARRNEAVSGIAEGWGKRQTVAGPYLAIPYERHWTVVKRETVDGKLREIRTEHSESQVVRLPAASVEWTVDAEISEKARGIYKARLYGAKLQAQGAFSLPARAGLEDGASRYKWAAPRPRHQRPARHPRRPRRIREWQELRLRAGPRRQRARGRPARPARQPADRARAEDRILTLPRARRIGSLRHRPPWRRYGRRDARRLAAPLVPGALSACEARYWPEGLHRELENLALRCAGRRPGGELRLPVRPDARADLRVPDRTGRPLPATRARLEVWLPLHRPHLRRLSVVRAPAAPGHSSGAIRAGRACAGDVFSPSDRPVGAHRLRRGLRDRQLRLH